MSGLFCRFLLLLDFLKKEVLLYTRIHSLLENWCRHSIEPRDLACPFKQSNLSAWVIVELTPHTYTPLRETLCSFKVVCSAPSRSRRVTWIMLIEVIFLNSFS